MNPILFTAAKGAERVMLAQEVRANNLAQANTVGFKSLMEHSTAMKIKGSGFETSTTTRTNSALNNFSEGATIHTDRPLDVKISGQGFFAVQGNAEVGEPDELYTRAGNFRLDNEGNLLLGDRAVIGDGGPIVVPDFQSISIDDDGLVSIIPMGGGANIDVANLKLVRPEINQVTMDSTGLFIPRDGGTFAADPDVEVQAGALEGSNVSSIEEMVTVMALTRQYEMQVKAMGAASEIEKIGNQLFKA